MPLNENNLNARQQAFVDNYVQCGNGSEAALKAGYSEKTVGSMANSLLKNPKICAAINTRMKEVKSKKIAETKEILEYLTSVMRGEHDDEVVMNIGKGQGVTAAEKVKAKVGAKERLKAAEMLAKVNGMFLSRHELEFNGAVPVVIKDDI